MEFKIGDRVHKHGPDNNYKGYIVDICGDTLHIKRDDGRTGNGMLISGYGKAWRTDSSNMTIIKSKEDTMEFQVGDRVEFTEGKKRITGIIHSISSGGEATLKRDDGLEGGGDDIDGYGCGWLIHTHGLKKEAVPEPKKLIDCTVKEIRDIAKEKTIGTGNWRAGASKDALIRAIESGSYEEPKATPKAGEGIDFVGAFTTAIAESVKKEVLALVSPENIEELVVHSLKKLKKHEIIVTRPDETKIDVGRQHKNFELLIKLLSTKLNVFLVGEAGSGKTTAVSKAAEALGFKYSAISVGAQTTQAQLLGFIDANSNLIRTEFRKRYEEGGICLLDEIDAGNPNVLTVINSAISNGHCSFPDGMVKRHEDFILVASGNTYGKGANRQYVGRNQLDAATLDRFVVIDWDYDEEFEKELAGNEVWTSKVQKIRKAINTLGIRHIVSPRASIHGAKLLAHGIKESVVEECVIWKGLDETSKKKVQETLRRS